MTSVWKWFGTTEHLAWQDAVLSAVLIGFASYLGVLAVTAVAR